MAMVTLSPTPAPIAGKSSRRTPLSSNPNVANSPLRAASALANYAKQKRSYATVQREEAYGQAPPAKKQALENGSQRPVRSPAKLAESRTHVLVQRAPAAATRSALGAGKERVSRATTTTTTPSAARGGHVVDTEKEAWKKHYKAKFPKMVFYFDTIPDDVRAKLTKRVTYFEARQEPFFSIEVTHVITTRSIPPERAESAIEAAAAAASAETDQQPKPRQLPADEQPQTINPSLLDRNTAARRKLLFELRQPPASSQQPEEAGGRRHGLGSIKARNNDVLDKAREMGKKIWSLDKFQNMLSVLLESEGPGSQAPRPMGTRDQYGASKSSNQPNLLQLLRNERMNGPSDRDPTAVNKDLVYFKGPYIYVSDMDEKLRPIMVRDYPKVANKADGEWPQFRSVGNGRCPFVEETEAVADKDERKSRARERARAAVAAATVVRREDDPVPILKSPETIALAKPITGKRTLAEMEDSGRNAAAMRAAMPAAKTTVVSRGGEERVGQNAFISRAASGRRLLAGEPVASGLQPSNMTSAIRSQMISSTSGINGAKAGTSKEVQGLQRKVLQKVTTPTSHGPSSRRLAEVSMEAASSRSTTINIGRQTSRTLRAQDDDAHSQRTVPAAAVEDQGRRWHPQQTLKSKKDLKPGYCENCQDKFRNFDEHIASRKHRKFAENKDNWSELDMLLAELKRILKYVSATESDCENAL